MKKSFVLLSAISISAFLSACGSYGHNTASGDSNNDHMAHTQAWNADHMEHMKMMTQYYFNQMDTNGDGVVSMKEFMAYQHKKFRAADTNHDGQLTLDEVMAQEKKEKKEMKEWKRSHMDGAPENGTQPDVNWQQRDMNYEASPDMNQGNRY